MFTGDERLINGPAGVEVTMLDFWRWVYSNISYSTQRGTFADFIVKCALDYASVPTKPEIGNGWEPYDLEGPEIYRDGMMVKSRIEVKAVGYYQEWDGETAREGRNPKFSIGKARVRDERGDIKKAAIQKWNNDLYVLCLFKGKKKSDSELDLSLWDFFVVPTYYFSENPKTENQRSIVLTKVQKLFDPPCGFEGLGYKIISVCEEISDHNRMLENQSSSSSSSSSP